MINQSKHEGIFEVSKLFKIKEMSSDIKYYLLMKLKPYNNNNKYLNIILNVYTSSPDEDNEAESDILFSLFSKCLIHNINIKNAIVHLRKILISNIDNLQLSRQVQSIPTISSFLIPTVSTPSLSTSQST